MILVLCLNLVIKKTFYTKEVNGINFNLQFFWLQPCLDVAFLKSAKTDIYNGLPQLGFIITLGRSLQSSTRCYGLEHLFKELFLRLMTNVLLVIYLCIVICYYFITGGKYCSVHCHAEELQRLSSSDIRKC